MDASSAVRVSSVSARAICWRKSRRARKLVAKFAVACAASAETTETAGAINTLHEIGEGNGKNPSLALAHVKARFSLTLEACHAGAACSGAQNVNGVAAFGGAAKRNSGLPSLARAAEPVSEVWRSRSGARRRFLPLENLSAAAGNFPAQKWNLRI